LQLLPLSTAFWVSEHVLSSVEAPEAPEAPEISGFPIPECEPSLVLVGMISILSSLLVEVGVGLVAISVIGVPDPDPDKPGGLGTLGTALWYV
jgi:hypothetical protein